MRVIGRGDRADTEERMSTPRVILVSCPDRAGIVSAVSGGLAGLGLNIIDADQHTDPQERRFFMRVVFEAGENDRDAVDGLVGELRERFSMDVRVCWGAVPARVVILSGRETHCLSDLLWRTNAHLGLGDTPCDVVGVVSNHEDARTVSDAYGAPFTHLPVASSSDEDKAAQERALSETLDSLSPDLVVLARYMRVLSAGLVSEYTGRMINIHHSFLPAFAGARPYHRAFERGVKLIGATAHYVTEDLDEGPIIAQQTRQVSHKDTVRDLVRMGRDLERVVLADAVRAHLEHKVLVWGHRTIVFG